MKIDPHSAVGITVAERTLAADGEKESPYKYISLSTAHPAKFSEVVNKALGDVKGYSFEKDVLPEELHRLASLPKKIDHPTVGGNPLFVLKRHTSDVKV